MIVLYKRAHCPLCRGYHDLWLEEAGKGFAIRPHEYVCPVEEKRVAWHPDVFAHVVEQAPMGAIQLFPIYGAATVRI